MDNHKQESTIITDAELIEQGQQRWSKGFLQRDLADRLEARNQRIEGLEHELKLGGEQIQDLLSKLFAERNARDKAEERIKGLQRDHNVLLIDGAKWQRAAEQAEAKVAAGIKSTTEIVTHWETHSQHPTVDRFIAISLLRNGILVALATQSPESADDEICGVIINTSQRCIQPKGHAPYHACSGKPEPAAASACEHGPIRQDDTCMKCNVKVILIHGHWLTAPQPLSKEWCLAAAAREPDCDITVSPAPQPSQALRDRIANQMTTVFYRVVPHWSYAVARAVAGAIADALIEAHHAKPADRFCPNVGCQIVGPHKHSIEGPAEDRHAK